MQNKDDKVGNKTANNEGKEGKKETGRERSKWIRKKKNFCACVTNKKAVKLHQISRKICPFSCSTHF